MRILFAVHGYKPAFRLGGPIVSVSSLAERLVCKGHQVVVFTTNSNLDEDLDVPVDRPIDVNGVEVWYFRREEVLRRWLPFVPYLSRASGFVYAPRMREALDRTVPTVDAVHTHLPFIYPTFAAARAAFRASKPLFYSQRGVFDPARLAFRAWKKRLYIEAIEKPTLRRATTLVALTEAEVQSYRRLAATPTEIVPNGIDVSLYRERPSAAVEGIAPESRVILFLGRIHPTKGADRLLEAFVRVAAAIPDAVLVLAGPDEFGLEVRFREIVAQRNLRGRVLFPGMVTGERKLDLLARADVFCLPSEAEGFSMAVLEALASATPVLLSPGCHFPQAAEAGAGIVVSTEPEAMAQALAGLLGDRDALEEMGRKGRALVSERYGWDAIAERMLEVYQRGIERHRESAA